MKKRIGRLLIPFVFLVLILSQAFGQDETSSRRSVLVLHSYHSGFTWTDQITRGIQETMSAHGGGIELLIEYMDTRRVSSGNHLNMLADIFREKYGNREIDVIICSDDHALHFMLTLGKEIFPGVPVTFCSVSGFDPAMRKGRQLTGLREDLDIAGTLKTALRLHPDTRKVAVITDLSRTGQALKTKAEQAFEPFRERVEFHYLENLPIEDLARRTETLGTDTIVFLFIFNRDKQGRVFSHEENLKILARHCPVPIYSVWSFYLGHGIVGGNLSSGREEGRAVAELALRILNGEEAGDIPLGTSPIHPMFDYTQLTRFGISETALPEGTRIINRPFSIWREYRYQIIATGCAIILLAVLSILLSINVAQRRHAQKELQKSYELLEERVIDRTRELEDAYEELQRETQERQAAQEKLIVSERLAAVGTLAGGVAHEFNNINMAVLGFADILLRDESIQGEARDLITRIRRSGLRARSITHNLLTFSARKGSSLDTGDLTQSALNALEIAHSEVSQFDVTVRRKVDALPLAAMDSNQIEQVILNLISNACHAMIGREKRILTLETRQSDDRIELHVSDTGKGMSRDELRQVFSPFFSTKGEHAERGSPQARIHGTGLGLSVSRTIMENHGGGLEVESEKGKGSTFWLWLPKAEPVASKPEQESAESLELLPAKGATVWVLDDERDSVEFIRLGLLPEGCEIRSFTDPAELMERVNKEHPDVLFLDVQMPALDGWQILDHLSSDAETYCPAIVLMSGREVRDEELAAYRDHLADVLLKPFELKQLQQALQHALRWNRKTD